MSENEIENIPPTNTPVKHDEAKAQIAALRERLQNLRVKEEDPVSPTPQREWRDPRRDSLLSEVRRDSSSPSPWRELLAYEHSNWKGETIGERNRDLIQLYRKAFRCILKEKHRKHEDYFSMWMEYAKLQM